MTTLAEITAGLEDRLRTIDGLAVTELAAAQPPFALVWPPAEIDYQVVFGPMARATFEVRVYGGPSVDPARALRGLVPFMEMDGPRSIRQALLEDPTLAGRVEGLSVPACRFLTGEEMAGLDFVGAAWTVPLHWRNG